MAQSAISFSILVSKYSFHIIDFDIGFEINDCQPEILISNLNEQFRTALVCSVLVAGFLRECRELFRKFLLEIEATRRDVKATSANAERGSVSTT